ncbi:MAG: DNA polymerase I, partial [Armatimonadota bacterium]
MAEKLVAIDGDSLLHRAYHALPPLTTSEGVPTNAVYGFAQMLLGVLEAEAPDMAVVAFDTPEPSFRHEQYEEYKANRPPMPDDLAAQIDLSRKLVEALDIPTVTAPGYEADDALGTVARAAEAAGYETVVVTGDRDALQLVNESTTVLATLRGIRETRRYTPDVVREEHGVDPERIADLKALSGDSSDNIPGVPGVGPKTGCKLLKQFGTLENLLEHVDEVERERLREVLSEEAEQARLSRTLATIVTDLPLELDFEAWRVSKRNPARARKLFAELEFTSLLGKVPAGAGEGWEGQYSAADEEAAVQKLCDDVRNAGGMALAILASPEPATRARLDGLAVATEPGAATFVPASVLGGDVAESEDGLFAGAADGEDGGRELRELLGDAGIEKRGHDLKRVAVVLARHGVAMAGERFDSSIASYTLSPHKSSHDLDQLVVEFLEMELPPAPGKRRRKGDAASAEIEGEGPEGLDPARRRACAEADGVQRLAEPMQKRLAEHENEELFREVEMPLVRVLAEMELAGVAVDDERLRELDEQMRRKISVLSDEVHALAGRPFNIDSPKQLSQVLFEELKLPGGRRTKTGYSTSADVLTQLAGEHEIAAKVLEYRSFAKLKSTYVEGLLRLIDPRTQRVHTTLNQAVAATGRLSSSDPNLQNIPIRTEWGREIRACFVTDEAGWRLLSADYSQIDLRVLAHLSEDAGLLSAFRAGEDIHVRTASQIFDVPAEDVTSEMRRQAKTVNFAVIYGMGANALALELGIPREQAEAFIENYFGKLPGVKRFKDAILEAAHRDGAVSTVLGRRREIPGLRSSNPGQRSYAERAAVNHPRQGSAADLRKVAMVALAQRLAERKAAA